MIYKPGLAATPDLIAMVPRRSNVLGSSDTKHTPDAPQPRFSSLRSRTQPITGLPLLVHHTFSSSVHARRLQLQIVPKGLVFYDLIIEPANSKKAKAATSAEILASKSAKPRIPKTKSLFGTNIALIPCTLLEELDKRQGSPICLQETNMCIKQP